VQHSTPFRAIRKTVFTIFLLLAFCSSFSSYFFRSVAPPGGYSGAGLETCNSCHQGNDLNTSGGDIIVTGLPASGYTPGTTYTFSIAIAHGNADRSRWGFEVAAVNALTMQVGTFSSGNPRAAVIPLTAELGHKEAPFTSPQSFYTFDELKWTAPANPGNDEKVITFYFAGMAANGDLTDAGDFVYTKSIKIPLKVVYTFTGNGLWSNANNWSNSAIPPTVISSGAEIVIDHQANGECILNVAQQVSSGSQLTIKPGKRLRLNGNLIIQ
jgi:hypothetical protein